eukprot:TRINITY_DN1610_c0_g1_i1.p1 TRINITY_DN1610_c0_g1~~TRINITY_DN1610_c0_g1_i1.p1  ORF type:complete len:313 (+),score=63.99 TRINITY_DN1610_c0_g1_i1:68-940(+)
MKRFYKQRKLRKAPPAEERLKLLEPKLVDPKLLPPPPRRLQRCERVLRSRTKSILLVVERSGDPHNQEAVLRTTELLGIQHVWFIEATQQKKKPEDFYRRITRGSEDWLTFKKFPSSKACLAALKETGREIWATDLSGISMSLDEMHTNGTTLPNNGIALVIGAEATGVSEFMLQNSDKRIFLNMHGFSDSFNLSVATALVLQKLLFLFPHVRGDLDDEERNELRLLWYSRLAKTPEQRELYAQFVLSPPAPTTDTRAREGSAPHVAWVKKKSRTKWEKQIEAAENAPTS